MGIFKKIKIGFKLLKFISLVKEKYMTNGMKSSEFWLTILTSLVTMFEAVKGNIPETWAIVIGASLTAIYTIARALVKTKTGETK